MTNEEVFSDMIAPPDYGGQAFIPESDEELGRKIRWLMLLRVATVTLVLGIAAIVQSGGRESYFELPLVYLYILIAVTYFFSFPYALILARTRHLRRFATIQFVCDIFLITAILYVTGGIGSIFPFLYLLVIFGASILLTRNGMLAITLLCCVGYGGVVLLEFFDIIHPSYSQISTPPRLDPAYVFYRTFVHLAAFIFVSILSYRLVAKMHRTTEELLLKQRDLEGLQALNVNIVQSINSGLITVDREVRITSFNEAAESITGYRCAEVLGLPISEIFPEIAFFLAAPSERSIDRIFSRWEAIFERRNGKDPHLGFSASQLRDRFGKGKGQVIIFQDLTRFKELEEELKRADRLAAVGELAAGMAHEIRNPLASLCGSIEVLESELDLDPENQRLMDIVLRESERLDELVTNFLLFAKPGEPICEVFDPAELIQETIELLRNHSACTHSVIISEELAGSVHVNANAQQIKQVLWNLFLNSVQAMPGGGCLTVSLRRTSEEDLRGITRDRLGAAQEEGFAMITVSDTGGGIDPRSMGKIFDPFFTTKVRGTGLGLAVAYRIVDSHQGKLLVKSKKGEGSTFTILLPLSGPAEQGMKFVFEEKAGYRHERGVDHARGTDSRR